MEAEYDDGWAVAAGSGMNAADQGEESLRKMKQRKQPDDVRREREKTT